MNSERIAGRSAPIVGWSTDGATELHRIVFDPASGILQVRLQGFWQLSDAEDYFERLSVLAPRIRRNFGILRVVVDRRGNPVQSAEVGSRLGRASREIYLPSDRAAVVVSSALLKMQLSRLFARDDSQWAFLSHEAALEWVAGDPPAPLKSSVGNIGPIASM